MIRLSQIKIAFSVSEDMTAVEAKLSREIAARLGLSRAPEYRVVRRSLDARRGHSFAYLFTVELSLPAQEEAALRKRLRNRSDAEFLPEPEELKIPEAAKRFAEAAQRFAEVAQQPPAAAQQPRADAKQTRADAKQTLPLVVGFGPAGMFCALVLARAGACPLVIERGRRVEERVADVERYHLTGRLDTESNVQFGEGGAGTFSDGKLATGVKDREGYGRFVLREMVKAGAPGEILYENKPHVGTDRLRTVVKGIREEIIRLGGTVLFETKLSGLVRDSAGALRGAVLSRDGQEETVPCEALFLAVGHSARDTFAMLKDENVPMEPKPFAVGVRVEHTQSFLDGVQYREYAGCPALSPADYKLTARSSSGRGVYSFCMCPGGHVIAAASEEGGVVTNGMSNYAREGRNCNSAVLVTVTPEDFAPYGSGEGDVLSGVAFQRKLERGAFELGGRSGKAPAQRLEDYLRSRPSEGFGAVEPSYRPGVVPADLRTLLPSFVGDPLAEGLVLFGQTLAGYDQPDAVLTGVESRSSSPVRILRDEKSLQSALRGLYPVGEGAGYAGGIMSAAMDGIRAALAYLSAEPAAVSEAAAASAMTVD